jgi:hypothetical protein
MTFLSGLEIKQAIQNLKRQKRLWCAVAFWGKGADQIFETYPADTRLICNLQMGGTNPYVIRKLMDILGSEKVRHEPQLHAKVYIGDTQAVITSANASTNGLGLEGDEQANWIEAGTLVEFSDTEEWFKQVWKDSKKIENSDLAKAETAWKARQQVKQLALPTFSQFVKTSPIFPLINWWPSRDDEANKGDSEDEDLSAYIKVKGNGDSKALTVGKWILWFKRNQDGLPANNSLTWHHISEVVSVKDKDYKFQTRQAEFPPPEPFDINDGKFKNEFCKLMGSEKYNDLRDDNYEGAYFTKGRTDLIDGFWKELKAEFQKLS